MPEKPSTYVRRQISRDRNIQRIIAHCPSYLTQIPDFHGLSSNSKRKGRSYLCACDYLCGIANRNGNEVPRKEANDKYQQCCEPSQSIISSGTRREYWCHQFGFPSTEGRNPPFLHRAIVMLQSPSSTLYQGGNEKR